MSHTPLISVLMPVYNAERYVAQAVDSILAQTCSDFEFLMIDDGSTDQSRAILQKYAIVDPRIRLISRANTGYAVALNEMLNLAHGEYVARMDADDIALPDRFKLQVEFLRQNPDCVCVGGAFNLIDEQGRLLTHLQVPVADTEIQKAALAGHGSICHPTVMMPRAVLLEMGGYNVEMQPAEDLDLWLRLGEVGKLANLPESVLNYRLHSKSVSEQQGAYQRQKALAACQQAWRRRGIEGIFEASALWRPTSDRSSRQHFMLQYGWWAFNSRQRQTAIFYGWRAIQALPWNGAGWKLLLCGLFKPLPSL